MEMMVEPGWKKGKSHRISTLTLEERETRLARSKIVCNVRSFDCKLGSNDPINECHATTRKTVETTYIDLGIDDVDETSENDNEVENVPSVAKVVLQ